MVDPGERTPSVIDGTHRAELDDENLRPISWSIAPPVCVYTAQGTAFLSGMRSSTMLEKLSAGVSSLGGHLSVDADLVAPPRIELSGVEPEALASLCMKSDALRDLTAQRLRAPRAAREGAPTPKRCRPMHAPPRG